MFLVPSAGRVVIARLSNQSPNFHERELSCVLDAGVHSFGTSLAMHDPFLGGRELGQAIVISGSAGSRAHALEKRKCILIVSRDKDDGERQILRVVQAGRSVALRH